MNKPLNIILVEDDTIICKSFLNTVDRYENTNILAVTNNHIRAIELIEEHLPNVVILDLELHQGGGTGIDVLKHFKNSSIPLRPYFLITTNNSSSITYDTARKLGADFILFKLQEGYNEKYVLDFLNDLKTSIFNSQMNQHQSLPEQVESPSKYSKRISKLIMMKLDNIGISPRAIGYNYIVDGVLFILSGEGQNIADLIGKKYQKTDTSVNRAMQNAISKAWRTSDIQDLLTHYTAKVNSNKGVPTVTEFLFYIAKTIKHEI